MSREESDEAIDRYNMQLTRDGFTMFAAQHLPTGQLAGIIGLQTMRFAIPNLPQPAVEIGWRLARPFHGQGLATEAARALLAHAFTTLQLPSIVSITAPANAPSRHVMEKIGLLHQPALTFEHPRVPEGHPYRTHVLYQLHLPATIEIEGARG
jgi:RimJ/RimL family protein N-acetyltransferase